MSHARGTVVYATDPFKEGDSGRPWVVVNTREMPFHGDQYVALTLSTKTWYEDRIPIGDDDVVDGGLPTESSILPWAAASVGPDEITRELARLDETVVDDAVATLCRYLGL